MRVETRPTLDDDHQYPNPNRIPLLIRARAQWNLQSTNREIAKTITPHPSHPSQLSPSHKKGIAAVASCLTYTSCTSP